MPSRRWVEFRGELVSLSELARQHGLSPATLSYRLKTLPVERAD